jgi:hypothetical protein
MFLVAIDPHEAVLLKLHDLPIAVVRRDAAPP